MPARSTRQNGSAVRVLCAEDEPETRLLIQRCLEAAGFQVSVASDGQQAWELLQMLEVDVLVTDNEMPRFTGLELACLMRQAGLELPILFVSGSISSMTAIEHLKLGQVAVLAKPFTVADLVEAIRRLS